MLTFSSRVVLQRFGQRSRRKVSQKAENNCGGSPPLRSPHHCRCCVATVRSKTLKIVSQMFSLDWLPNSLPGHIRVKSDNSTKRIVLLHVQRHKCSSIWAGWSRVPAVPLCIPSPFTARSSFFHRRARVSGKDSPVPLCQMPRNSTNRRLHSHAAPLTSVEPWRHLLTQWRKSEQMTFPTLKRYGKTSGKIQFMKNVFNDESCYSNFTFYWKKIWLNWSWSKFKKSFTSLVCFTLLTIRQHMPRGSHKIVWLLNITENSSLMLFWTCGKTNKASVSAGSTSAFKRITFTKPFS